MYRDPGPDSLRCSGCGAIVERADSFMTTTGAVVCRSCNARATLAEATNEAVASGNACPRCRTLTMVPFEEALHVTYRCTRCGSVIRRTTGCGSVVLVVVALFALMIVAAMFRVC